MNEEIHTFSFLFECESSKRLVECSSTIAELPSLLELELKKIAGESAELVLDVARVSKERSSYLLQRYCTEWMEYIDVISPIEIASGDKLCAVPLAPRRVTLQAIESKVR